MDSYVKLNATWTAQDYGKPGLPSDVEGKFWETNLSQFYVNADDECSFAMKLNFANEFEFFTTKFSKFAKLPKKKIEG